MALLALAGCVGDGVQYGGTEKVVARPASAESCETAPVNLVERGPMTIPGDVTVLFMLSQKGAGRRDVEIGFDINEAGEPVNVHFVGDPAQRESDAQQKMIRAVTDSVEASRYSWPGKPSYAADCTYDYTLDMVRKG
ncbi:MAG: hypothetical protein GC155_09685 [Alphaproteobacteria bacterium]|nr:hypothetical protein [Alphaproteobacteria bacterium]